MDRLSRYGRGIALPLLGAGGWRYVETDMAVAQAIVAILLTEPGERVGRPDFGVGLRRFLFAQNTVATRTAIRAAITDAVGRLEHRIDLADVIVATDGAVPTVLRIELIYALDARPGPQNLVFSFDLEKGLVVS